jgi:hypothetical protein
VVEAGSGTPLAGVALERTFAGSIDARARSGPDGGFAFPPGVAARGTLCAVDPRWRFEPARLRLQGRDLAADIVFEGTRVAAAPVAGRLLDERTGMPVSRYRLTLLETPGIRRVPPQGETGKADEDDAEELVTDGEGRFASASSYEAGNIQVWLSELGDRTTLEHRIEAGSGPPDFEIPVGPAFYFDLEVPAGADVGDLEASLLQRVEPTPRWMGHAVERGYTGFVISPPWSASAYGFPSEPDAYVRSDGDPAWIRLKPLDPDRLPERGPDGYALRLVDEQAHLAGMGHAPSLAGGPEERVHVRLAPCCELSGTVATEDGAPVHGAWVTLRGPALAEELSCVTDASGTFSCLAPQGLYELSVDSLRGSLRQSVSLGEPELALSLRLPRSKTMRVAGTLRSQSGRFKAKPRIELRSTTDPRLRFLAQVEFSTRVARKHDVVIRNTSMADASDLGDAGMATDEITEMSFQVLNVPAGSYVVGASSPGGFSWAPARVLVDRPTADVHLVYLDDAAGTQLYFDVHGPDGALVTSAHAGVWVGGESTFDKTSHGEALCAVATGAEVRWVVYAPGYVPLAGVSRVAQPTRQRIAVQLEPGAGLLVTAVDPWGLGVEGAEILLDGEPAGFTDEVGVAALHLRGEVSSISAQRPGWICVRSSLEQEDGEAFLLLVPED